MKIIIVGSSFSNGGVFKMITVSSGVMERWRLSPRMMLFFLFHLAWIPYFCLMCVWLSELAFWLCWFLHFDVFFVQYILDAPCWLQYAWKGYVWDYWLWGLQRYQPCRWSVQVQTQNYILFFYIIVYGMPLGGRKSVLPNIMNFDFKISIWSMQKKLCIHFTCIAYLCLQFSSCCYTISSPIC